MKWVYNEYMKIKMPKFGFIEREEIFNQISTFLTSVNPICIISGAKGCGKTTIIKEYFDLNSDFNAYWFVNTKKLENDKIPKLKKTVLIIDEFGKLGKTAIKVLEVILEELDFKDPQFKIIIISRDFDYNSLYELIKSKKFSPLFNFYEKHLIDINQTENESFDKQVTTLLKETIDEVSVLFDTTKRNIGEIVFLLELFENMTFNEKNFTEINQMTIEKRFEEIWGILIRDSLKEYNEKKAKIRSALITLSLRNYKLVSEFKENLLKNLEEYGLILIFGNKIEIRSNVFAKWIIEKKWLNIRNEVQIKANLQKILKICPIRYVDILNQIVDYGYQLKEWFLEILFTNEFRQKVGFGERMAITSKTLILMSKIENFQKLVKSYSERFFKDSINEILLDINAKIKSLPIVFSIFFLIDPMLLMEGFGKLYIELKNNSYSEDSAELFLIVFTGFLARNSLDTELAKKNINEFARMGKISKQIKNGLMLRLATFQSSVEKYKESFETLFKIIETSSFTDEDYIQYHALVSISGVLIYFTPDENKMSKLEKLFEEIRKKVTKSNYYLKIYCGIEANLAHHIENYSEKRKKLEEIKRIAENNNYTDILAAVNEKLGFLCLNKGKFKESVKLFVEAIDVSDGTLTVHGNTLTARKMADAFLKNNEINNAEKAFLEVIKFAKIENSPRELIEALIALSRISIMKDKVDDAENYLESAEEIVREWGNKDYEFTCYVNTALIAIRKKEYALFERKLRLALNLDKKINLGLDEKAYLALGIIFGSEATKTNINQIKKLIVDFKKKYKNTIFKDELITIFSDVLLFIDIIRPEVQEFVKHIINELEKRGIITSFLENIFLLISDNNSLTIEAFRKKQGLLIAIRHSMGKFTKDNEYYLACSFFLDESHISYAGYSSLELKRLFENIKSKAIIHLLLKISHDDKHLPLLGLLSITKKLNELREEADIQEIKLPTLMMEIGALMMMKDYEGALVVAEKIEEYLKNEDIVVDEVLLESIHLYSDLFFKNRKIQDGVGKIEQIYNRIKDELSPDEEARILFSLIEYYFMLEDLRKVKDVFNHLAGYKLNYENKIHLRCISARINTLQENYAQARNDLKQLIFSYKKNEELLLTDILISIISYLTKINQINEEDELIKEFYLENFRDYNTLDYSNPHIFMISFLFSLFNQSDFEKAIYYSREFAEFFKPIDPILAKTFYFLEIRARAEIDQEFKSIIDLTKNLETKPSYIDVQILMFEMFYLINEQKYDDIPRLIIEIVYRIEELDETELKHMTNNDWVSIFVTLAPLSDYPLDQIKLQKAMSKLKLLKNNEKLDSWIQQIFSWSYDLLENSSEEVRIKIAKEMKEAINIPLDAKEPIITFLLGRVDPVIREENLVNQLQKYRELKAQNDELRIMNELCELYFQTGEREKCRDYAKKMLDLALEYQSESYVLEGEYWFGSICFREGMLEKAINHIEKIIKSSEKAEKGTFIESAVLFFEAKRKMGDELSSSIDLVYKKGEIIETDVMKLFEYISAMSVRLGFCQLLSPIIEKINEILERNNIELNEIQKINYIKIKLRCNLFQRDFEKSCYNIVEMSRIVDNSFMWIFILKQLDEFLDQCVRENRKIFFIEFGAKIGREIRDFAVPDEFNAFLTIITKEVLNSEIDDYNSTNWFFRALFRMIEAFKIREKKLDEKYTIIIIVEGPSEQEVIPVIFNRFYKDRLPNWKDEIGIIPLEGTSKIKQIAKSEGINLSKLAERIIILIDSDKKDLMSSIPQTNREIINEIYKQGGTTHVLRKREIENYVHPAALKRQFPTFQWTEKDGIFGDFDKVKPIIKSEIKRMDNKKGYSQVLKDIFNEMTETEFSESQTVTLPNGQKQKDFDKFVEKIIEALYS